MPSNVRDILNANHNDIAFIVGNGINRYRLRDNVTSWNDLLLKLWKKHVDPRQSSIPSGISLTEFYDLLEIHNYEDSRKSGLQKEFCDLMSEWIYKEHHIKFIEYARRMNAPVLTTNFEDILQKAGGLSLYRTNNDGFTDYYPWETYYGMSQLNYPTDGFGVWHINGMQKYHRSIRLGLSHYMGSVERARVLIHKGNEDRLFTGKDVHNWKGVKSWLHIIFNKSLFIFGLELAENEIFLRWLLIERAKYFRKFRERQKSGWYIAKSGNISLGKKLYLEKVGFSCVELNDFSDIYGNIWRLGSVDNARALM